MGRGTCPPASTEMPERQGRWEEGRGPGKMHSASTERQGRAQHSQVGVGRAVKTDLTLYIIFTISVTPKLWAER